MVHDYVTCRVHTKNCGLRRATTTERPRLSWPRGRQRRTDWFGNTASLTFPSLPLGGLPTAKRVKQAFSVHVKPVVTPKGVEKTRGPRRTASELAARTTYGYTSVLLFLRRNSSHNEEIGKIIFTCWVISTKITAEKVTQEISKAYSQKSYKDGVLEISQYSLTVKKATYIIGPERN